MRVQTQAKNSTLLLRIFHSLRAGFSCILPAIGLLNIEYKRIDALIFTSAAGRRRLPLMAVIALAWLSLLLMFRHHPGHGMPATHHMPPGGPLGGMDFLLMLPMWWGMAIAMMLPTALPALDVLEELIDTARRKGETTGRSALFILGFVTVWFGFGVLAAALQWALHNQALLTPVASTASAELTAALFILAGLYQWTPLKESCVSKCRSPMAFFLAHWESGDRGFWNMGLGMGKYCLGCCWAMMLLMFALGVMNLLWMGLLTLYMYAEKNWIQRRWFDRASGLVLAGVGILMLALPSFN